MKWLIAFGIIVFSQIFAAWIAWIGDHLTRSTELMNGMCTSLCIGIVIAVFYLTFPRSEK